MAKSKEDHQNTGTQPYIDFSLTQVNKATLNTSKGKAKIHR